MKAVEEIKHALRMVRGLVPLARAGRRYRSAVAFQAQGRAAEAFAAAEDCLNLLRRPGVVRTSPPALTVMLPATELFAILASAVGKQDVSTSAIREALNVCKQTIQEEPRMNEWEHLRNHVARFEQRLQQSA